MPKIIWLSRIVKFAKETNTGEGLTRMAIRWHEKNPHYVGLPDPVTCAKWVVWPILAYFIMIPGMILACAAAIAIKFGWEWPPASIYYILIVCAIVCPFLCLHLEHWKRSYKGWRLRDNIVLMLMQRAGRFCEVITLLSKYSRKKFSLKWTAEDVKSEAVRILKNQAKAIVQIQSDLACESVHGKDSTWGEAYTGQIRKERENREQFEQCRFNQMLKDFLDVADIDTGREAYFPPPTP